MHTNHSCTYCAGACEAAALKVEDRPISPLAGFDGKLVLVRALCLMSCLVVDTCGLYVYVRTSRPTKIR